MVWAVEPGYSSGMEELEEIQKKLMLLIEGARLIDANEFKEMRTIKAALKAVREEIQSEVARVRASSRLGESARTGSAIADSRRSRGSSS